MGQFQKSINNYKKAIALDSNFASSYVGVASNLNLLDQHQEARQILKEGLATVQGEMQQRMLHYGIVISFLDEEDFDAALQQMILLLEFDSQHGDTFHLAEDIGHVGDIYSRLEQFQKAREQYIKAYQLIKSADIDPDIKGNTEISYLSRMARIAIKKGEMEKAADFMAELESKISGLNDRNKTQVYYSLLGQLALKKKEYDRALGELRRANLHSPYVLWYMANAYEGKGDIAKAREYYRAAANHNSMGNFYYALIRKQALRKLENLEESGKIS
jgi:tetratricopeptide (TPR) repeat protein